jgi:hypothetical protein
MAVLLWQSQRINGALNAGTIYDVQARQSALSLVDTRLCGSDTANIDSKYTVSVFQNRHSQSW